MDLYKGINGIYKNGIIHNKFIAWNSIQVYNFWNNSISFGLKNGNSIEYHEIDSHKENIEKILGSNNIKDNNALDFA